MGGVRGEDDDALQGPQREACGRAASAEAVPRPRHGNDATQEGKRGSVGTGAPGCCFFFDFPVDVVVVVVAIVAALFAGFTVLIALSSSYCF